VSHLRGESEILIALAYSLLGVDNAQWYPLYDLYASSQDGKPSTSVSLHYRVNLLQGTGEDWNDAKLILSTSETNVLNAGVPKSDGLVIEPKQPSAPAPSKQKKAASIRTKQTARRTSEVVFQLDTNLDETEGVVNLDLDECDEGDFECDGGDFDLDLTWFLPEMSEGGAMVSKTPMGVNYAVDGLTTIRSDGESHKVLVASVPFEAAISHITTPRKSPLAYLQVCSSPVEFHHHTDHPVAYSAP